RIERHDVQAGRVDGAARGAVAQVADVHDGAAAFQQRTFEVDDHVDLRPWLAGHGEGAAGDAQVRPAAAVRGQFVVQRARQSRVRAGGDGVERAGEGEEVQLAQALLLQVALDAAGFDQDRGHAGLRRQVAERARVEGIVPL